MPRATVNKIVRIKNGFTFKYVLKELDLINNRTTLIVVCSYR